MPVPDWVVSPVSAIRMKELLQRYQRVQSHFNFCLESGDWGSLMGLGDCHIELQILREKILNFQKREEYAQKVLKMAEDLRASKGLEYSRGEVEINSNFKRLAEEVDIPSTKVAYIFAKKHWDSISYMVKTGTLLSETPEQRIADLINYLIIIGSLHAEKNNTL